MEDDLENIRKPTELHILLPAIPVAFLLWLEGCNTLDSDIKQFALLCEQNVEALWRSQSCPAMHCALCCGLCWALLSLAEPCWALLSIAEPCWALLSLALFSVLSSRGAKHGPLYRAAGRPMQSSHRWWINQRCCMMWKIQLNFKEIPWNSFYWQDLDGAFDTLWFTLRVCKQLSDWESLQAWLCFEPHEKMLDILVSSRFCELSHSSTCFKIAHVQARCLWHSCLVTSQYLSISSHSVIYVIPYLLRSFPTILIHLWRNCQTVTLLDFVYHSVGVYGYGNILSKDAQSLCNMRATGIQERTLGERLSERLRVWCLIVMSSGSRTVPGVNLCSVSWEFLRAQANAHWITPEAQSWNPQKPLDNERMRHHGTFRCKANQSGKQLIAEAHQRGLRNDCATLYCIPCVDPMLKSVDCMSHCVSLE